MFGPLLSFYSCILLLITIRLSGSMTSSFSADDTHLYLSMKPDETCKLNELQRCLNDIKTCMATNFLLLNSDKTKIVVLGPEHFINRLSSPLEMLDAITLTSRTTIRDLGVNLDLVSF